jgi:hypothetical protein
MSDEVMDSVNEFLTQLDDDSNSPEQVFSSDNKDYENDLYKKWFRSKTQSGFLSIRPWFTGMKFKIDIGKTSPDGKLISHTHLYVDAIDFAAYLRAIVNGNASAIFPANERMGIPTSEGFASYGGSKVEGKAISRIFKAHHWTNGDTVDPNAFVWKAGHFAARVSDTGAFIPDMKSPMSVDSIKVTRQDICSISYILDLALNSYVANNQNWYEV